MKKLITICLACVLTTSAWGTVISLDEYGHGYKDGTPLTWGVAICPVGPSSPATLYYNLGVSVVNNGDLATYEYGTTDVSDVLRFTGSQVFFYSKSGPFYADTGIPTLWTPVVYDAQENYSDVSIYTPSSVQVGYMSGGVTYTITPEPATMTLLGLGGLALLRNRRFR